jgi:hypothetical protein
MVKKKEKPLPSRPAAPIWREDADLDEIEAFILDRNKQPIELARGRLRDFVNRCVNDSDFRHPQSEALLSFLLIVRDHLCHDINENWTLADILQPVENQVRQALAERRMGGLDAVNARREDAKKWATNTARQLWEKDTNKSIRIAKMAGLLWPLFVDSGFVDVRPDNGETIKDWIRPVAPEYATVGGRPRKVRTDQ